MQTKPNTASNPKTMLVLMSLSTLYAYMYCMLASGAFSLLPVFGGALFMCGQITLTYFHVFTGANRCFLSKAQRVIGTVLLVVMLLCCLLLLTLNPIQLENGAVWCLFAIAGFLNVRNAGARKLVRRVMRGRIRKPAFVFWMAMLQLVPIGAVAAMLFYNLHNDSAWQMFWGFVLSGVIETYSLWRERKLFASDERDQAVDSETARSVSRELKNVSAYGAYQRMNLLILVALQVTLVLTYSLIGLTSSELLTCLILTCGATVLMREVTDYVLQRLKSRPAVTQMLIIGLFLWVYGLYLLYRQMQDNTAGLVISYIGLGVCTSGLSIAVSCLAELERKMVEVAQFTLKEHMEGYGRLRAVSTELAIVVGQMLALLLLALLCVTQGLYGSHDLGELLTGVRPLLVLPALLLVLASIISALHFPLNSRYFDKLNRFLGLEQDNTALKRQLDDVVVHRHKNRFGVKLIIFLLRPFYYHKVLGRENLAGYRDGDMILVSNHGELYGPIVCNLYLPISFRPWTISELLDAENMAQYTYDGMAVRQKWCPDFLKMPLTKLGCNFLLWILKSLEAIPVYRKHPHELMKTFRLTVEAMQAGDNILLFPEDGEDHAPHERGYVLEGIGKLYTGFAMIAPAYYAKTKRRAVFIPVYASKALRTLTLGKGIVYNPDAPATDEKLRLVNELRGSITAMYEAEETELTRRAEEAEKKRQKQKKQKQKKDN